MAYQQISFDDLGDEASDAFWNALVLDGVSAVAIDVDTETASIIATNVAWRATGLGPIGVRMFIYNTMLKWNALAESTISDMEYETEVMRSARMVLSTIEAARPAIISATYTIDGDEIEA